MSARRTYLAAAACAVGAGLALISLALSWGAGRVADAQYGGYALASHSAPGGLRALGLAALAGAVGIVAARGRLRRVIGVLVAALGAGLAAVALTHTGSAAGAAALATAGALLIVAAGVVSAAQGAPRSALGTRFDVPHRDTAPRSLWDAIERGHDPT